MTHSRAGNARRRSTKAVPREPALVLDLDLLGDVDDVDERVAFLGQDVRIVRTGLDAHNGKATAIAAKLAAQAQAIAISGTCDTAVGRDRLREACPELGDVPVTHGDALHAVLQEWAVRHVQRTMPGYFTNARVVVLGRNHDATVRVLREYTDNITYAESPVLDVLGGLRSLPVVGRANDAVLWPARGMLGRVPSTLRAYGPVGQLVVRKAAETCDVVVATYDELVDFGMDDLAGKAVISTMISDDRLADLAAQDVDLVLDCTPQPFDFTVDAPLLEALMVATSPHAHLLSDDELLDKIVDAHLEPRVLQPNGPRRKSRFAFVIHPLSQRNFENVEPLRTLSKVAPGPVMSAVERAVAYTPPFMYSHVTGIKSPTGAEAEGWLITVGGTPKQLLAHSPEFTYARLLAAADMAKKLGAQVMGLGAFTKVVGDAGVTVARQAPLPVTTGNSYSASATLWAAHEALRRLGLVDVGADGVMHGKAMVVGATGSIGSVCARLLALAADELWLVSPEAAKLLALKTEIEQEHPRAQVHIAATAARHVGEMDLIVTATSAAGKHILDIMAVKPGCVITDVARPLDISAEDVARRPDVLVIESGEIEVPGEVHMRNVGLPNGVVYACMAETVVLALEGRYETFTVGRDISWERVKEIYRLGLKHGMKLAAMSGVNGVFTDVDVARVRKLALAARANRPAVPERSRTTARIARLRK